MMRELLDDIAAAHYAHRLLRGSQLFAARSAVRDLARDFLDSVPPGSVKREDGTWVRVHRVGGIGHKPDGHWLLASDGNAYHENAVDVYVSESS